MGSQKKDRTSRFELPFGAPAPLLRNHELGIERIVTRGRGHRVDVTILDAPDHRLVRAGVLLAQRHADGGAEWTLAAPEWEALPDDATLPGGDGDVPEEFAALVRPFRRSAPLQAMAECERSRDEYHLRSADDLLAVLADEQVTIRRGGLTISRFREVTLAPTEAMTAEQRVFVEEALLHSGGARVAAFASLAARLGAPATGPSDMPAARGWGKKATMAQFVSGLFSQHLQEIVAAELDLRVGTSADDREVVRCLRRLESDVAGLYPVLDAAWLEELSGHVEMALDADDLLGEHYVQVLDALVESIRTPQVGSVADRSAVEVMSTELDAARRTLSAIVNDLDLDSDLESWLDAQVAAEHVAIIARSARHVLGRRAASVAKRATRLYDDLGECVVTPDDVETEALEGLHAQEIFELGRVFEQSRLAQLVARDDFLAAWPKRERRLGDGKA